jgi:PD-(D/E)XK endonuclease
MDWMGSRAKGKSVDRLAGGKLQGCKERGEWAEMYFSMLAAGLGMKVLRPYGQTGVYDLGVERLGRLQRVQVKSTIYRRRNGEYSLNVMGPGRKMYAPGTVDFFAILLIPVDYWYIVPYEVIGRTNSSVHFTPAAQRQKYGEYREAWDLLRSGVTIQACGEDAVLGRDDGFERCTVMVV